mgnify:FL=1
MIWCDMVFVDQLCWQGGMVDQLRMAMWQQCWVCTHCCMARTSYCSDRLLMHTHMLQVCVGGLLCPWVCLHCGFCTMGVGQAWCHHGGYSWQRRLVHCGCMSQRFILCCMLCCSSTAASCTRLCLSTALHLFPVGVLLVSAVQVDLHHHQVPSLRIGGSSCLEN